jgi:hypothetical protein
MTSPGGPQIDSQHPIGLLQLKLAQNVHAQERRRQIGQ